MTGGGARGRWALAPLAALLLAPAAGARTYWVSPAGVPGRSGADSLANATTLAWFNANAQPGDVCRFRSGTYRDPIQPARDGTPARRIRYYGFPQDPGAVTVADIRFGWRAGSFCTARWFHAANGITGCDGVSGVFVSGDSIAACSTARGDAGLLVRGKACVFDSLAIRGTVSGGGQSHWIDLMIGGNPAPWFATDNVVSNGRFTVTVRTGGPQGDVHVVGIGHGVGNRFVRNTFDVTVSRCAGYFFCVELYEGYGTLFHRNTWNVRLDGPIGGSRGVWCHRDSSSFNRWTANVVNVSGRGSTLSFMLSNPGSFPGTTGRNYYGGNSIRDDVPQPGTGVLWFYDGSRSDTLESNAVLTRSNAPCVMVERRRELNGSLFRRNTSRTGGLVAFDGARAVASNAPRAEGDTYGSALPRWWPGDAVRVPPGFAVVPAPATRGAGPGR